MPQVAQRPPIRVGNASGAIGDGIDQIYRLAKSGAVDAITADYLAEFNIAWKAIELQHQPDLGYEPNFLEQLEWENGDAARLVASKGIKIVHNGGALNPRALAIKADAYFKSLGLNNVVVAAVTGDDVTGRLRNNEFPPGVIRHLDHAGRVFDPNGEEEILAANVYTGQAGIVRALEEGADIVICGRCCDASPVMALASWWHKWNPTSDYHEMAGSLMAGHLIECGAYVTGGNFCGAQEIAAMHHVGYPIAEIAPDGTCVITKPPNTNGAVTVDTCKAQLLYEIQGHTYLNPDVTAHLEQATLTSVGRDRVALTGIRGSAPPPTAKLAICLTGGWQAELSGYCAGLDTDFKFQLMRDQIMRQINPGDFTTFSIKKYGSAALNPKSQAECTVQIRMFAQAPDREAFTKFRRAIFYNGMQGYCGLHLSMDWRTMEPKQYVKYFPALLPLSEMPPLVVSFINGPDSLKAVHVQPTVTHDRHAASTLSPSHAPSSPPHLEAAVSLGLSETTVAPLGDLVFARSGDKGGNANVGFWVRNKQAWPWLRAFLCNERLIKLLADEWKGGGKAGGYSIERCEFPHLKAVHFVVKGILEDGVSSSSILDGFAKSFGEFLRARHVEIPVSLLREERELRDREQKLSFNAKL